MKAMVLIKQAPIEKSPLILKEIEKPEPKPGEVRIKVSCCAICRTDLHVIEGDLPYPTLPLVPGHQIIGTIDKVGKDVKNLHVGQRIGIAWLRKTCGKCDYCISGRENLCSDQKFTGYHQNGGFAEYAVVHEEFAYQIPNIFNDTEASPLLCAGIIGFRSLNRSHLPKDGTLGIFGFGSSAHIVIQLALHRGARVFVVTRGATHRTLAKQLGATWVGEEAKDLPEKTDSAIIFAPAGELVPEALASLKKGGTVVTAGIYMTPIPQLDYETHLFNEHNLRSVTANTRQDGIDLLEESAEVPITTHVTTYHFKETNKALYDLKHDKISGTGVIMVSK